MHADRAGHPSVRSFLNNDDTKLEYNACEPVNDRKRWTEYSLLKLFAGANE